MLLSFLKMPYETSLLADCREGCDIFEAVAKAFKNEDRVCFVKISHLMLIALINGVWAIRSLFKKLFSLKENFFRLCMH